MNQAIVTRVLVPFATMGAAAALAAWLFFRRGASATAPAEAVPLRNPFSLTEASKFAGLFAVVLLVVKLVQSRFPGEGLYLVAVAGLTDVDAITLSMADYAKGGGDPHVAVTAIVLAALTNTVTKCAMVVSLGGRRCVDSWRSRPGWSWRRASQRSSSSYGPSDPLNS